ncbi:DJ-1/PfpI family protein [Planifilum fulgidum]|uniref:DJ-1/PfpI family protein n=1 Tax=Planifilum fulgidum TaxID=201973 RepID=A0A1I2RHD9_9BACL|nr:DJ-1/PfpI family protein [Planifilum fulgidum]MBO2497648.1 DJ-1/PfpI family protein [Bacillota bacterium]MBO2532954.1 DJ-1/PfpI family protein [Thermoactinomycetaceae bacterium]SFG39978.1 DJ-1/PfpI family protein [Planifilum fulgidum]
MNRPIHVGIFLFDGVDVLDFSGPYEVFSYAARNGKELRGRLLGRDLPQHPPFLVRTVSEGGRMVTAKGGLRVLPDCGLHDAPSFDVLLLPGASFAPLQKALGNQSVLRWIRERSKDAEVVASVCTGAYFLAEAGLLSGKRATTHHAVLDHFQKSYPEVRVCRGRRVVDEGGVITSGGVTSGIHLALHIVRRFLGEEAERMLAGAIEFEPGGTAGPGIAG